MDEGHFLSVNVHKSPDFHEAAPAVALRIFSATTAHEVCRMVIHKLKLPGSKVQDTAIIMVRKVRLESSSGAVEQVLHTLRDDERPVDLQSKALEQYLALNSFPEELGAHGGASGGNGRAPLQADEVVHWYFRDSRSLPLELEDDASGSEESEDESTGRSRPSDLAHLNEDNCTRCAGFLLKQSARDANLWRKRFCILTGDKLWYMKRRPQRCRGRLIAATCLVLVSARVTEAASNVPFGFELQTVDRKHSFRAFGRQAKREQLQKVQRGWLQALAGQIRYSDENDMISMAEHIISDTEGARVRRAQRRLTSALSLGPTPTKATGSGAAVAEESAASAHLEAGRLRYVVGNRTRRTRFIMAVQQFREEACSRLSVPQQWAAARKIFNEYLKGGSMRSIGNEGGVSIDTQMQQLKEARLVMEKDITDRQRDGCLISPVNIFDGLCEDAAGSLGLVELGLDLEV